MEKKTPGQIAYEADCKLKPYYHPRVDGTLIKRLPWQSLSAIARWSWERNPTPRDWKESSNG